MGNKSIAAVSMLAALLAAPASAAEPRDKQQPAAVDAANSEPETASDDMSYRFDMEQNGKRMTADEFDAWMKARGVRVATGKPAAPNGGAPVEQVADE